MIVYPFGLFYIIKPTWQMNVFIWAAEYCAEKFIQNRAIPKKRGEDHDLSFREADQDRVAGILGLFARFAAPGLPVR